MFAINRLSNKARKQKNEEEKRCVIRARGLHFVCCPQWCACLSSAAASLAHCIGCRAVGKLEVKAEAAADARRD